jgi:hypothetical protein
MTTIVFLVIAGLAIWGVLATGCASTPTATVDPRSATRNRHAENPAARTV